MAIGNQIVCGGMLFAALTILSACESNNYYDESVDGTGIFHGGDSYRLRQSPEQNQPYQYAGPAVATSGSEIRIFTHRSYRGDLHKLTTACARQAGVTGPITVNTGIVKGEKYASLLPASNVSAYQQERTAQCVEASIK